MPSESGDRRPARQQNGGVHPPEPEHLPCPRCDSTNTKFCYYNNYNLSQPRHFCKGCRRYWTRGGTLRNVPVGGGTRKNTPNKRARNGATPTTSSSSSLTCDPVHPIPGSIIAGFKTETTTSFCTDMNLNENVHESENFTSLLNQGGFGFGIGSGYREIGFGLGAGVWQMEEAGGANGGSAISTPGCNTWQMGSVEGGMAEGECFGWPDLAISTPGWGPK